jgi:hypothetical protein
LLPVSRFREKFVRMQLSTFATQSMESGHRADIVDRSKMIPSRTLVAAIDTLDSQHKTVPISSFRESALHGRRAPPTAAGSNPVSRCGRYSRLMGIDEAGTLARLKALRRDLIDPKIAAHAGRIVKLMGDSVLVVALLKFINVSKGFHF